MVFLVQWQTINALKSRLQMGDLQVEATGRPFVIIPECWPQRDGEGAFFITKAMTTSSLHKTRSRKDSQDPENFVTCAAGPQSHMELHWSEEHSGLPVWGCTLQFIPLASSISCFTRIVCRHLSMKCHLWSIKGTPGFYRFPKPISAWLWSLRAESWSPFILRQSLDNLN